MDISNQKASLEEELLDELSQETERRKYDWVESAAGITWEMFSAAFPKHRLWFFTLLDISLDDGTGWQQLAQNFGLNADQIKWCSKFCGPAGPTSAAFYKLQQKTHDGLSLHHILHHLISLGRHDLLSRIPWQQCIDKLKEDAHKLKEEMHDVSYCEAREHDNQDAAAVQESTTLSAPHKNVKKTPAYACSVLLIHASDAQQFAVKLCAQLRAGGGRGRIGVLLLQEQEHVLLQDPHSLLYKWFTQVDYIVPVLSPELLRQISGWSAAGVRPSTLGGRGATALLNRFVYRLTLDQYVAMAARNKRCRPVVSAFHSKQVCSNELVRSQGLLQVVTVCDDYTDSPVNPSVEQFAHLLLKTAIVPL
ncbi:Death-like domain [Trinorchestia longiramus]|nr:Death-like domain [Trinorchestia longiramus]